MRYAEYIASYSAISESVTLPRFLIKLVSVRVTAEPNSYTYALYNVVSTNSSAITPPRILSYIYSAKTEVANEATAVVNWLANLVISKLEATILLSTPLIAFEINFMPAFVKKCFTT